jgi:hypothetical protein
MFYRIIFIAIVCLCMLACSIAPVHHAPVFTDDIAPIIHNKCAQCHLEGEAGPFSLLNYEDVTGRAKLIRYLVNERIMPPWPADASYSHFANELVLTDTELETINTWIDAGMPVGDSSIRYTAADVKKRNAFGEPDMIVKVPDVPIPGSNEDLFLVMKIPFELPADTCIRAIEFVPGNKKLVHHVNTHLITFDTGKKKNVFDGKYWINQNKTDLQGVHRQLNLLHDDGSYPTMSPSVSNYLPGSLFSFYPSEIGGYRIGKKNAFYLNDLHYGPTPVDAKDSSYFKIYFTSHPPKRPVKEFQLGTLGIAPVVPALIVPADEVKTFRIQATIPEDISLISIVPHMHLIGKSYLAYAVKPNGDTIPLIRIPRWDFRWQYFYQFKNLLKLPRGTTIYVEGVYDNTAENPNNPFQPPREIREREGSMKTTDEMFQLIITYVPYQQGDENISQEIQQPK